MSSILRLQPKRQSGLGDDAQGRRRWARAAQRGNAACLSGPGIGNHFICITQFSVPANGPTAPPSWCSTLVTLIFQYRARTLINTLHFGIMRSVDCPRVLLPTHGCPPFFSPVWWCKLLRPSARKRDGIKDNSSHNNDKKGGIIDDLKKKMGANCLKCKLSGCVFFSLSD